MCKLLILLFSDPKILTASYGKLYILFALLFFCKIVCPDNTYGQKCQRCGHCQNPQCNWSSETGICFGGCTAGYSGENCQSGIQMKCLFK